MVKNDHSWFQEDTSWWKTTTHGAEAIAFERSAFQTSLIQPEIHGFGDRRRGLNFGPAVDEPKRLIFDPVGGIQSAVKCAVRRTGVNGKTGQGSKGPTQ